MKPLVVFGAGEFARCVHFYLTHDSEYRVAAFTVDREYIGSNIFQGLPVVPFDEVHDIFPPAQFDMFIAIGYSGLNSHRSEKYCKAKEKGYSLVSYISSKSTVWPDLQIGDNCFIGENNVIHPFATIGNSVVIWSGNLIAHGAHISDNCFITSHVVVAGGSEIKENCFLGINSTIREHIKIARNCIIGANSYILRDTCEEEAYITDAARASRIPSGMLKHMLR